MSYNAKIGVDLDTSRFSNSAKQAGQSLDQVKNKGHQAMRTIDTSTTQATQKVNQLKQSTDRATMSFQANGMAMLAIGTSVAGAYTSISNLNKATIAVARTEMGLKRAMDLQGMTALAVERIEFKLKKMREAGKETTEEYAMAVAKLQMQQQKLRTANEDLLVKESDLLQKKDDLQDTYILFSTMMVNTVVSALVMGKMATQGMTKSMITNKIVTVKNTLAKVFNAKANLAVGATSLTAVGGLKKMTFAMKLLNLSMGKIILIAVGVVLAFEGIAQVIKHFNPEIDITIGKLSGDLFNAMDQTMNSAMGVETAFAETGESATEMGNNVEASANQMDMMNTNIQTLNGTITGIQTGFKGTQQAILEFNKQLEGEGVTVLNAQAEALTNNLQMLIDNGIDPMSAEFKLAFKDILPSITAVADNLEIAFGADTAKQFIENFKKMSKGAITELDSVADKYVEVKKKQRDFEQLADSIGHKYPTDDRRSDWQKLDADIRIGQAESNLRSIWEADQRYYKVTGAGRLNMSHYKDQLALPEYSSSLDSIAQKLSADITRIAGHDGKSTRFLTDWATNARRLAEGKARQVLASANAEKARLKNLANRAGASDSLWRDIIVDKNSRRQLNDMIAWKQSMGLSTTGAV